MGIVLIYRRVLTRCMARLSMWVLDSLCEGSTSTSRMVGALSCVRVLTETEEFQTGLESFASHLVLENQTLQHENKQLNNLLKEYEQTLETVMGKFRGVAVSTS